ncbi:hypothetical protein [Minwuia sp.]|uniref:hypothetical protein n=1 Tax=Minwuia sp. TaxID=2493630 RepID=UPI003A93D3F7
MARKRDDAGKCMDAALSLAAIGGWNNLTLYDIARETKLEIGDVVSAIGSRHGALAILAERADQAMLGAVDEEWDDESRRDRLFTLLMARFDFLRDRREGIRAVMAGLPGDPGTALRLLSGSGVRSMRLTLEAAGIPTGGVRGAIRIRALGAAYAAIMRTFLDDDSEDLSRTMAAVDRRLNGLENMAGRLKFRAGRKGTEKAAEPA